MNWFLIGLARQKKYLGLYVNAAEDDRYLSQSYGERLGGHSRRERYDDSTEDIRRL